MTQDILQRFLTARHFDVGGDDSRLTKLREAAGDLAEEIKATQQRAMALTMVAIDAKTPAAEPIFTDIGRILEKRWPSYAGAFSDAGLPVVMRAMALEALGRCASSDSIALVVTAVARNLLPHLGSMADRELWDGLIQDADRRLEARARREWALPSSIAAGDVAATIPPSPQITSTSLKREGFAERMAAASGPQDANGTALAGATAHWPNAGSPWSFEFAPKASKAIVDAIEGITNAMTEKINVALKDQSVAAALVEHVGSVAEALAQTAGGLERRTSMLWWKEALYSPGANASYRGMGSAQAAGWAAVDAIDITGPFAPRMAEALLAETVRSLGPEEATRLVPLRDLANIVAVDPTAPGEALRGRLAGVPLGSGRTALASLIATGKPVSGSEVASRLGLPEDFELAPVDLTLWIFRELQAARATAPKPRRKSAK